MKTKTISFALIILFATLLVVSGVYYLKGRDVRICLNGGKLNDSENILSSGSSRRGPWLVIRNEPSFYEYLKSGARKVELSEYDVKFLPEEVAEFTIIGSTAIKKEKSHGHYIYATKRGDIIVVWSVKI